MYQYEVNGLSANSAFMMDGVRKDGTPEKHRFTGIHWQAH